MHGNKIDRRTLLRRLLAGGVSMAFADNFLRGGAGLPMVSFGGPLFGTALGDGGPAGGAGQKKQKILFIFMDGGVCGEAMADPKFYAKRTNSDGSTTETGYTPAKYFSDQEMGSYSKLELQKYGLAPGSHNLTEAAYTPPILVKNGLQLGSCTGPFLDFADKMTVIRGVASVPEHGIASRIVWTGGDFAASAPRPTIDCLVASKLKGSYILPFLCGGRSGYVPVGIPDDATQIPFPNYLPDGKGYADAILSPLKSRFTQGEKGFVGADVNQAVSEFLDGHYARHAQGLQNPANQRLFSGIKDQVAILNEANKNPIGDKLTQSVDTFISTAGQTMGQILGHAPWFGNSLLGALGTAVFAFQNDLSSVATINIGNTGFDAHAGIYATYHPALYRACCYAVGEALKQLDLTTTTVVLFSEFTRNPVVNGRAGRDHGDSTWYIMFGPHGKGQVFGGTTDFQDPMNVDPATGQPSTSANAMQLVPAHIHAFLLESVGYAPGRELQAVMQNVKTPQGIISQAPDFLRNLLT